MNIPLKKTVAALGGAMLAGAIGTVAAHGLDDVGAPACLEANFMMANAQNAPFAAANGAGNVLEVNIVTGARGITVNNPFTSDPLGPVCGNDSDYISCRGDNGKSPFKPTGVLSGGLNGHAFITSAAQQALTEFHRDGTPIRTISYKPITGNPIGNAGLGSLPRPLGTQMMPNGNIIQAICDANFFNAQNSDREEGYTDPTGANPGNISYKYFPPVYSTPARAQNSRLLVIDQETLAVIDEYTYPHDDNRAELWGCMAGIAFTEEGMGVSMFHTAAIAMVDWMAGLEDDVAGVGSNDTDNNFEIDTGDGSKNPKKNGNNNEAQILRWIDLRADSAGNTVPDDDPSRRDSLRAWGLDEDGTIYVTDRERSKGCVEGQTPPTWSGSDPSTYPPCHPGVFRQKVQVVDLGDSFPSRTIGLDPGVNVIAGIRPNRMSATACTNIGGGPNGECDVETILIAASAFNPGCAVTGGTPPAPCFVPGGGVGEYSIHPDDADGASASCTGVQHPLQGGGPASFLAGGANEGCAQPIATFLGRANGNNVTADDFVDPRMLMVIHEAFVQ